MSSKTYNNLLIEASDFVSETTQADEAILASSAVERSSLHPLLSELRVRYTILLEKLDVVYDQLLQPQKRLIIKRLLEGCLGRLLELKHELVELHLSDYSYDDEEVIIILK